MILRVDHQNISKDQIRSACLLLIPAFLCKTSSFCVANKLDDKNAEETLMTSCSGGQKDKQVTSKKQVKLVRVVSEKMSSTLSC